MRIPCHLYSLTIQTLFNVACTTTGFDPELTRQVAAKLWGHFTDPSQRLPRALQKANDRAWSALELALLGTSWWETFRVRLASAEHRALRDQIQAFLERNRVNQLEQHPQVRKPCLDQLRAARKAGLLQGNQQHAQGALQRFGDPLKIHTAEQESLTLLTTELRGAGYQHLAWLLALRPAEKGPPLLVLASRYFFRREIEEDAILFRSFSATHLESLSARLDHRFSELAEAQKRYGANLQKTLEAAILPALEQIKQQQQRQTEQAALHHAEVIRGQQQQTEQSSRQHDEMLRRQEEQRTAALDIQQEQQRHGQQLHDLYQAVIQLQQQFDLQGSELRAKDSYAIRKNNVRKMVQECLHNFRNLKREDQERLPALLSGLGKLFVGIGMYDEASRLFEEVEGKVRDRKAKAEASYNRYRALLEKRKTWPKALSALLDARDNDPERFALFPMDTYKPETILDVSAVGVTFRCRTADQEAVTVKVLSEDTLDRSAEEVFQETKLLKHIKHDGIVRPLVPGYMDPANKARPYLVMEFPGMNSLGDYLHKRKKLPTEKVLELVIGLAEILQAVHDEKIVHRDINPANVLLAEVGGTWKLKLTGFGMAIRADQFRNQRKNLRSLNESLIAGQVASAIEYAAPEQLKPNASRRIGTHTDIYSVARVCCFALFKTSQPSLNQLQSLKPRQLANLLDRCLAPGPRRRPSTMQQLIRQLRTIQEKLPRKAEPSGPGRQQPASPSLPPFQPRLSVVQGLQTRDYLLQDGITVIGRPDEKPVDIDLEPQEPPDRVWSSRQHACIRTERGKVHIKDLGSTNGTFVNGAEIKDEHRLKHGDTVQIGTVRLEVKLRRPKPQRER